MKIKKPKVLKSIKININAITFALYFFGCVYCFRLLFVVLVVFINIIGSILQLNENYMKVK